MVKILLLHPECEIIILIGDFSSIAKIILDFSLLLPLQLLLWNSFAIFVISSLLLVEVALSLVTALPTIVISVNVALSILLL